MTGHVPFVGAVSAGTAVHTPSSLAPATLEQTPHAPSHGVSQQTPSAQNPEEQPAANAHGAPLAAGATVMDRPTLLTPFVTANSRPGPGAPGAGGIQSADPV